MRRGASPGGGKVRKILEADPSLAQDLVRLLEAAGVRISICVRI
jgi:hypothetical protein